MPDFTYKNEICQVSSETFRAVQWNAFWYEYQYGIRLIVLGLDTHIPKLSTNKLKECDRL